MSSVGTAVWNRLLVAPPKFMSAPGESRNIILKCLNSCARVYGLPCPMRQVKVILCGFVVPQHLTAYTLAAKVPGLLLAVSSGLVLGDEGPFCDFPGHSLGSRVSRSWFVLDFLASVFLHLCARSSAREMSAPVTRKTRAIQCGLLFPGYALRHPESMRKAMTELVDAT